MRRWIANAMTAVGTLLVMVIVGEAIFRALPVADAVLTQPVTEDTRIISAVPKKTYTYSRGWAIQGVVQKETNNVGFFDLKDYAADKQLPVISVIGDSFVEALQVENNSTFHALLQDKLSGSATVFSFGLSAAPLSQYVAWLRQACDTYQPQAAIINIVANDFDESFYPTRYRDGFYHYYETAENRLELKLTPFNINKVRQIAYQSSLLRYVFLHLRFNETYRNIKNYLYGRIGETSFIANTSAKADHIRISQSEQVMNQFFQDIQSACIERQNLLLVIDGMREVIYTPEIAGKANESYWGKMRQMMIEKASSEGIEIVDLHESFERNFQKNKQRFDFTYDYHWNILGHKVVADSIEDSSWFSTLRPQLASSK